MPVSRETAAWGLRMLLGVEPASEKVLDEAREGHETLESLRAALLLRPEARALFAPTGPAEGARFAIAPFLLRPSPAPVPCRFEAPDLADPVSQLCTAAQVRSPTFAALAPALGVQPGDMHRKYWEFAFIVSALRARGMLAPGKRGLGFGTGQEPLPAIFAASGATVVATDAPDSAEQTRLWADSAQWTADVEKLWRPDLIDRDSFMARVSLRPADMNAIPAELRGFDFNWSASCMDHLGSIRNGLDFFHNCLETLRPGGVAVHTTEFNVRSDEATLESPSLTIYRKRDFETVFAELIEAGHAVAPLNTWPGIDPEDAHIDRPPFGLPHLKLEFGGEWTTSIGVIITKKG